MSAGHDFAGAVPVVRPTHLAGVPDLRDDARRALGDRLCPQKRPRRFNLGRSWAEFDSDRSKDSMSAVRILHVDDEPDIREIVGMSLGLDADFEVRHCACGADAVATAAEWSPFLILLDVAMPVMDGPTTLKHLRTDPRTADIPVLFMTAHVQACEVEHFVSLGAQGVISKPFDPMELAAVVRSQMQAMRWGS
jgi:CheY-like chemotaxis protein